MMLFSKKRANAPIIATQIPTNQMHSTPNSIQTFHFRRMISNPPNTLTAPPSKLPSSLPPKKVMKWGEPTWFLLHTLAEKIKPEIFDAVRPGLLDVIYSICINLPCPDCSNHAKNHLDSMNFKQIRTKEQLKNMLFEFHNIVNAKKGYPLFPRTELDSKYSAANTLNIIHHFMFFFEDKNRSPMMIASDLHRSRVTIVLKEWFNKHIQYFN